MSSSPVARTVEARKVFGGVIAVDDLSMEVEAGEVVGLLGANGAGKTTLIKLLLGLLRPTSGLVEVLGGPPDRSTRRRLGYLAQGSGLYEDLTVSEQLSFVAGAFGVPAPSLPSDLVAVADLTLARVPLGVRRRVAFLAALCHHPDLLVLDEPTSGVGPLGRAELWDAIRRAAEGGAGVLVTTHHMDEAEQCDRLVVMAGGREVAAGTLAEITAPHTTIEVVTDEPGAVLARLEETGVQALPSPTGVRVPGGRLGDVELVLDGLATTIRTSPASLEEAFIVLASALDGRIR
jgi:ABC-2 type transport system ATP-binding protein